jgi:hypothetical protein
MLMIIETPDTFTSRRFELEDLLKLPHEVEVS